MMWTSKHHLALFLIFTFSKTNKNNRNHNNSNCACHIIHKNIFFSSLSLILFTDMNRNGRKLKLGSCEWRVGLRGWEMRPHKQMF
jgi:hypothetical protein